MARLPQVTVERAADARRRSEPPAHVRRLTVGAFDDPAEREADQLASLALSAQADWEREPPVTGDVAGAFEVPAEALDRGSPGQPLPEAVRRRMEDGFGTDLSAVRVHDGADSARLSQSLAARAFTHGSDIHFGAGEYRPGTPDGDHVLAHELAHVVQDGGAARRTPVRRFPVAALSGPVDWGGLTADVFRPGEGLSGGVYILSSRDPEAGLDKVVVKPVFGRNPNGELESGETMAFGDRAIREWFGVATPVSRVVQQGSPEYAALLAVCGPKAPAKPEVEDPMAPWKPLSAAESFVVMSAVPEGTSLKSLSEKAANDPEKLNELQRALFDENLLFQLGQLVVADMLLGNNDRINAAQTNLGNLMVSMAGDAPTVYAIDTNAVLDRFDPKQVVSSGSGSSTWQGGFRSVKATLEHPPEWHLDTTVRVVISNVREAAPAPAPGELVYQPADIIKDTYEANKPKYVGWFEAGWQDAMAKVQELVETEEGKQKMKDLTGEFEGTPGEEGVQYQTLKVNALYLAGRAKGQSHQESGQKPGVVAAVKTLQGFDPETVRIPQDEYYWTTARRPSKDATTADLPSIGGLKAPKEVEKVFGAKGSNYRNYKQDKFDEIAENAQQAKEVADSLGTKTRGVISKKEVTRNRTLAARFVAETYQLSIGAARALARGGELTQVFEVAQMAAAGALTRGQAQKALPAVDFALGYLPSMERDLHEYAESLRGAAEGARQLKKYEQRKELAGLLDRVAGAVSGAADQFSKKIDATAPDAIVDALLSAGR